MRQTKTKISRAADRLSVAAAKGDTVGASKCLNDIYTLIAKLDQGIDAAMKLSEHNASFALAIRENLPLPLAAYSRWGGYGTLRKLAQKDGKTDWSVIGAKVIDKKVMIQPACFSAAIKQKYPQFTY